MKKTILLTLIFPFLVMGQINVDHDWASDINQIFQHLDKSKVTSGILLDYAMDFTEVTAYDGTLTDSTYINVDVVGDIYKTLFMGKVVADTLQTPLYDRYAYNWARERYTHNLEDDGTYILSGLLYEYHRFDENAYAQGKITVSNNKYYDRYVNGIWQNPYITQKTLALTPPLLYSRSGQVRFKLPDHLLLSNIKNQITSIEIDPGNGSGYQPLPYNSPISLNFYENKVHDLTFKVTLNNGEVLFCRSKFLVDDPLNEPELHGASGSVASGRVFIYPGNDEFLARMTGLSATLSIFLRPGQEEITRPLIIAEGFDAGSFTAPEDFGGEKTLLDFNLSLANSGNLDNQLELGRNDYDIIYVDWTRGTADLRNNSLVLEEVVNWVNQQKAIAGSEEPNVLLGQSMGGVIGRYTLARMERNDPNFDPNNAAETSPHDVRLFIAHDSPMQGANTPLSAQHLARQMRREYVSTPIAFLFGDVIVPGVINSGLADTISDFLNNFGFNTSAATSFVPITQLLSIQDRPAARQLNSWSLEDNSHVPTQAFHTAWQQILDEEGYPLGSRNIAISNGNECTVDNGFFPGAPQVAIDSRSAHTFLDDIAQSIIGAGVGISRIDPQLTILSLVPGKTRWQTNIALYSMGNVGQSNLLYHGKLTYEKKVLWIGPRITRSLFDRDEFKPSTAKPLDTYSGGTRDFDDSSGEIEEILPEIDFINNTYGFIPVASGLDIRESNGTVAQVDAFTESYSGGMVANMARFSPFDAFIVDNLPSQPGNNAHLSFQARNGNWLANELDENPQLNVLQDCSIACEIQNWVIDAPDFFCDEVTVSVPPGAPIYEWNFPGGVVTPNPGQPNIVRISAANGPGILTVSFPGLESCGLFNFSLSKEIFSGTPRTGGNFIEKEWSDDFSLTVDPNDNCQPQIFEVRNIPDIFEVDHLEWELLSGNITWSPPPPTSLGLNNQVVFYTQCPETIVIRYRYVNQCGASSWMNQTINLVGCDSCPPPPPPGIDSPNFTIYPVPTDGILNIVKKTNPQWNFMGLCQPNPIDPTAPDICQYSVQVVLYDSMGIEVYNQFHILNFQLDFTHLPAGNYVMHLIHGSNIEVHNIPIN